MAETMVTEQLRRPTRSEDLITIRRYGYVEQGNKDYLDVKTKSRPTRSEDLYRNRRFGYAEAATAERRPSPIISKSEWLQARKRYGYVEKDQTADTMMFPQLPRPINARSEDLHTRRRYGYVEQGNGGYLDVTTKPRPSRSEDLHKSRRCGYVEENTEDEIFRRENRDDRLTPQHIQDIKDKLIDGILSRENRTDNQTNKAMPEIKSVTSMIQPLPRHINARSEDSHTRRRYGYVEQGNKDYWDVKIKPRPTQSEDLYKSRRWGYVVAETEDLADQEQEKTQKTPRPFCFSSKIDKNPEKKLNNNRKRCRLEQERLKTKDVESQESLHVRFYKMKQFPHFQYVYNQTAGCESRVQNLGNDVVSTNQMAKDIFIKIRILGDFTDEDLNLISKSEGRTKISKSQTIWEAKPVVSFQNHHSSKSKLKEFDFHRQSACHKILIKSDAFYDNTDENDDTITSVPRDRTQIQEAITFCLEEPIDKMLKEWLKDLKSTDSSKFTSRVIAEIEAIRKQMTLENNRDATASSALLSVETTSVVPEEIKDYLFGRPDVNSFGIWRNSSFKIHVEETDENMLRRDLSKMNPKFFETYKLEVEKRKLVDRLSKMIQGDSIMAKIHNKDGNYRKGTLGGFVTKSDEEEKKYALTCNHTFPEVDEPAYNQNLENIGSCLFTTRDQSCDFAAIEIEQSFSDKCDVYVKRDDKKKTNAQVYTGNIENIGLVHKIGATTDITKGNILSPEWHERVLGENWVSIFLVQGIEGNFSEEGDSGSLVFSRPRCVQQNSVDVMGMVYCNKLTVCDNDENNEHVENNLNEGEIAASNVQDADNISGCFRIHTALELFKESQGEDFEVKFKDDLSSSSPSSSLSDDSNEEPI